jgi:hypothetical protein
VLSSPHSSTTWEKIGIGLNLVSLEHPLEFRKKYQGTWAPLGRYRRVTMQGRRLNPEQAQGLMHKLQAGTLYMERYLPRYLGKGGRKGRHSGSCFPLCSFIFQVKDDDRSAQNTLLRIATRSIHRAASSCAIFYSVPKISTSYGSAPGSPASSGCAKQTVGMGRPRTSLPTKANRIQQCRKPR